MVISALFTIVNWDRSTNNSLLQSYVYVFEKGLVGTIARNQTIKFYMEYEGNVTAQIWKIYENNCSVNKKS